MSGSNRNFQRVPPPLKNEPPSKVANSAFEKRIGFSKAEWKINQLQEQGIRRFEENQNQLEQSQFT